MHQGHEISRNKGQVQTIDFPVMNMTKHLSVIITASTCLCRLCVHQAVDKLLFSVVVVVFTVVVVTVVVDVDNDD